MSASESHSALVLELAEEFLERYRQGQRPSLKEYIARHPELAAEIKEVFPAMALMENVALDEESLAGAATGPEAGSGAAPLEQLGDYRILREIGRGGMGIVYEAEQVSLGRHVALKVLPRKVLLDDAQKRRFEREAKAAAKLHHTNIVPVFGVGEHDGLPYYVMQFIQGLGLDAVLEELKHMQGSGQAGEVARSLMTGAFAQDERGRVSAPREPAEEQVLGALTRSRSPDNSATAESSAPSSSSVSLPGGKHKNATYWQSVAQIGVQVADALEYAHKQGIQHRDIKPSNLLLDTAGTVWVTDFRLARADNEDHLTATGDIVGTLRYMPPEAFEGRADKRGDIYSLGLTLYEMLARQPAFEERDRHRLIKRVTTEESLRLDKLNRSIPRDLVTIVHKAIDREPSHRYQTAGELSADLQRFLDDEPIRARRISNGERLRRWCRHHPGVAMLTATLTVILLAVTVVSLVVAAGYMGLAREKTAAANSERQARDEADKAKEAAEQAKEHETELREQAEKATKQAESSLREAERQNQRAAANFAKACKAVDHSFTKVSESQLLQVPGMQPLRRDLLQSALAFYQDLLKQRGDDPALRGELAAALLSVGKIRLVLNDKVEARKAYEQARELYETLREAEPDSVEWQHGVAQCYYLLRRFDESIALWQKLVQPGQPRYQKDLADAYNDKGVGLFHAGRLAEAQQAYQRCMAIREMLVRLNSEDANARSDLGGLLHNIGMLLLKKERLAEALAMFRRAAEHSEIAFAQAPQVLQIGLFLANHQILIANIESRLGNVNKALAAHQRHVEIYRKLARENPAVPWLHSNLFAAYRSLARYQRQLKQNEQAERTMRLAREVIDRMPSDGPVDLFNLACLRAECSTFLAGAKAQLTAEEKDEQKHEQDLAMETLRKAVAAGFGDADRLRAATELNALRGRDDFRALQADLAARLAAAPPDKLKANQQALDLRQKAAQVDPKNKRLQADLAASQHAMALIQLDFGKLDEARKHLEQAIALREGLVKAQPANAQYATELTASRCALGEFYWKSGRLKEAENYWRQMLSSLEEKLGDKDNTALKERLAIIHRQLGDAYGQVGLWEEAAAELEAAFALGPDYLDGFTWFGRAALAQQLGKTDRYQRICRDFAQLPSSNKHSHYLVRLSMLGAGAYADAATTVTAAEQGFVDAGTAWNRFVLGAAHYRAGRYAEAERRIRESMDSKLNPDYLSHRWLWLALVCQRQGKPDEAKQWLTRGVYWLEHGALTMPSAGGPDNARWYQALEMQLLRREAEMLIAGKATPEPLGIALTRLRAYGRLDQRKKAESIFEAAAESRPNDLAAWLDFGRTFAEIGWEDRADAAFAKAAALTPEELDRFPQAGWWVIGPYPEDLKQSCPPENDPDPSRPAVAVGSAEPLHWRAAPIDSDGRLRLWSIFATEHISAYALTYVYSPDERTATLMVGGDDRVRVWLNGRLVHETDRPRFGDEDLDRVPVVLKSGRNTLLCKISQKKARTPTGGGWHFLYLRIADNPLDRALLYAQAGLWHEAAAEFVRGIDRQPTPAPQLYTRCAHAQLLAGDTAGYRRCAARMLARFGRSVDTPSWIAFWLVYAGGLEDGAVNPRRLVELAERALQDNGQPSVFHAAGLAHYRAGQFDKAIERFEESLKSPAWQKGGGHASEMGLALAHHRLGHAKEARQWLDKAEQWYEKAIQDALASPIGTANLYDWADWPSFVVLRREAHKQVLGTKLKDDPRLKELAERMRERLKKFDKATADYDVAILLSPDEPRLRQARGRRLTSLKRTKEAEADFAKAQPLSKGKKDKQQK